MTTPELVGVVMAIGVPLLGAVWYIIKQPLAAHETLDIERFDAVEKRFDSVDEMLAEIRRDIKQVLRNGNHS